MKRKWMVWIGLGLVVAIAAAILANNRQRQQMDREVTAILAAAKAAGEPITTEELARWHRRNIQNGNVAPVIERAVATLPRDTPKVDVERALTPLPVSKASEIALDQPLPKSAVESLERFVGTNAQFFLEIGALTNSGEAVFNLQWAEGYRMLLPHLSTMKKAAEAVGARCYLHIDHGDVPRAMRDIDLVYRLSSSLTNEPTLISQYIRMSIASKGQELVNRLLCQVELTEPDLQLLARSIDRASLNDAVVTGLIGERALGLDAFNNPTAVVAMPAYGSSSWRNDRWLYLRSITELAEAARMRQPESLDQVELANQRITRQIKPSGFWLMNMLHNYRKRTAVTAMLIPGLMGAVRKGAEALTAQRIARAAIAVELYRLEHERLPLMLSDVAPFTSPDGLIDPFTGKQLIYKTNSVGSAYVIYGVGKDRKDNGGPNINPNELNPSTTTKDIIFPVTIKRQQR